MEALELDPGSYTGTYKRIGGRLSLDLVNTVSWPHTERRHDWLEPTENLGRWLAASDLTPVTAAADDLDAIRTLRQDLDGLLRPLAQDALPTSEALARFGHHLEAALPRRRLDPDTLEWAWAIPHTPIEALAPVVFDAADLVARGDRKRLRACPACDWLFEDQTRNGRRRWCDMADCGSRDKARRYYRRSRQNSG